MSEQPETEQARVRRAPKYPAFMIVGGGIGAIVTFILTGLFPADPNVGFGALFAYFSLYGVSAGVVLGAIFAIVLDRVLARRSANVVLEREVVEPEPETLEGEIVDDGSAEPQR